MLNYDFRNLLSAFEFECFSRDLINVHWDLDLASFAEGRDGGIDLRCTSNKGKTIIVQAKRYRDFPELKAKLPKEVEKVKKLNPDRYMISTTVDLTASNKEYMISLFKPYIKNENDILGKQDLNRLLGIYTDIEQKYYKLWLASTSVLFSILKKDVINWTSFERQEIEETVKTYVMNGSFDDAFTKLVKNRYVVISGVPGIGKTTLARMLVANLLSEKFARQRGIARYDDFYYTDSQISDLTSVMQEGKRQIFFFDDFMGRISFEEGEKNFDSRIKKFIKACQHYGDKLLILTTREYILQQGLARYARFTEDEGLELSKCIVDMGKYTRYVRAEILYNHLVANEIPQPYIDAILEDKNYLKLIDHENYSPRIIERFLGKKTHNYCSPEEYFKKVLGYFDHPDEVWLDAFKRLSDIGREALLVLSTMNGIVMYDDWKDAYGYFFSNVHKEANYLDDQQWNDVVKMLQDNFIKIGKGRQGLYVDFHNPGVCDVLMRYIKNSPEIRKLLLAYTYYVDQIFGVFRDDRLTYKHAAVPQELYSLFVVSFDRCWDNFKSCRTILIQEERGEYYGRNPRSRTDSLYWLKLDYETLLSVMPGYLEGKISQSLMTDNLNENLVDQLSLLDKIDVRSAKLDMEALFENYKNRLSDSSDCYNFASSIEKVFPNHLDFLESNEFCEIAVECLKNEFLMIGENIDELDSTAKELCKYNPNLEYEQVIADIQKADEDYFNYIESRAEEYMEDYRPDYDNSLGEDAWRIDNLFSSIKS